MIRHIVFAIDGDFDFTTWGLSMEDFETDTKETIQESVEELFYDGYLFEEIVSKLKIKKVWYEEDGN